MQTQTIVRTEEHRVGTRGREATVRQLLGEADVKRVTVRDTHGHTIVEIPVRPDEVGRCVIDAARLAATKAIADRVGDLVLQVEKEPRLPAEGGSRAGMREREREQARRQATGEELPTASCPRRSRRRPRT